MYESITILLELMYYTWPTKRNRSLWRKFKLLKKQDWYRKLQDQHLKGFHLNEAVREYIEQWDVPNMVKEPAQAETFTIGLKEILKRESF